MYLRELDIYEMMALDVPKRTIYIDISKKYSISQRTVERQYKKILEKMQQELKDNRSELRSKLMVRNDLIYRKSMQDGKYKTALDANMAQAKLGGALEPEQNQVKRPEFINFFEKDNSSAPLKVVPGDD